MTGNRALALLWHPAMWRFLLLSVFVVSGCDGEVRFDRAEASRPNALATARGDVEDTFVPDTSVPGDTSVPVDTADTSDTIGPDDTLVATDTIDTSPSDTSVPGDTTAPDTTPDTSGPGDTTEPDVITPTGPVLYPPGQVHSPIPADLADHLRGLAAIDPALQDDVFMKVGASSFAQPAFVRCFAGNYDLATHSHLEPTRAFFAAGTAANTNPFSRASLSAVSGKNAGWAITGDPSPMEQEYLAISPRFAFVMYGANDMGAAGSYQASLYLFAERMWTLVDELIAWGVTPILLTISRRMDSTAADRWVPTFNSVIRGLAQGRGVPFIDVYHAFSDLPNAGVSSDGLHASTFSGGACVLTPQGLQYGHNARNLAVLEALSRVEAVVVDHVAALDTDPETVPRLTGDGSPSSPFQVPFLPFTDMRSTADSPHSNLDVYTGCGANQNERGPEWLYRVDVASRVRIRATVHDLGASDIDLHLLGATPTTAACIRRDHQFVEATLDPGTYHFALDSFVSNNGQVRSGEYLFTVIDCDADPPGCL